MLLCSCGSSSQKADNGSSAPNADSLNAVGSMPEGGKETASSSSLSDEQVGPQFQTPGIQNLKGVPQRFPANYVLKRYPKSQTVLVYVRPHLTPGEKNQVMLRSSDKKVNIADYYKKDLVQEGWKLAGRYENSIYSSTRWQKDGQELEVRVSPDVYNRQNIQLFSGPMVPEIKRTPDPSLQHHNYIQPGDPNIDNY